MESLSGVRPGAGDGVRRSLKERGLLCGMNEEGGAAIDAGLEQAHALLGGDPALHDHVVEFFAQELVHHALVSAGDLNKVGQRAYRGHAFSESAGLEQAADGVSCSSCDCE